MFLGSCYLHPHKGVAKSVSVPSVYIIQHPADKFGLILNLGFISSLCKLTKTKFKINGQTFLIDMWLHEKKWLHIPQILAYSAFLTREDYRQPNRCGFVGKIICIYVLTLTKEYN